MQCFDTKRISAYVLMQEVCQIWNTKKKPWKHCVSKAFWRSGWDSNPRALADNLISSQARYDHFDTAPYDKLIQFLNMIHDFESAPL